MFEGRSAHLFHVALVALWFAPACFSDPYAPHDGPARPIDSSTHRSSGSGRKIAGPTADSTAYVVGPGAGTVTVKLSLAPPPGEQVVRIDALIQGSGFVTVGGSRIAVPGSPTWVTVQRAEAPGEWTFMTDDDGSNVTIVDLRLTSQLPPLGCGGS